ncbi:unnamed protein product [Didymodactylos carnosus]|uniref:Uncharacterized protein n=1 Tax=Didymodactylos carnosus TaxID=1234261 RepID=A0A813S098_9BILA|nr:unnamed protein product [Didymodactylos carnosus]CAF0903177.1 unnamed protein product [Didymodactylos carnosus]CAF3574548.1 unnamed protein product [Didymodactylos carnosus]CAF3683516.1 unnamed protein product [Didymodactylos carnosus]
MFGTAEPSSPEGAMFGAFASSEGFFYLVLWSKLSRLNEQKNYTFDEMIEHLKTLYDESVFDNLDAAQHIKEVAEFKLDSFAPSPDQQSDLSTSTSKNDELTSELSSLTDERRTKKISVTTTQRKARTRTQTPYSPASTLNSSRSQSQPNDVRRRGRRAKDTVDIPPQEKNNKKITTRQQRTSNSENSGPSLSSAKPNEPISTRSRKTP